ncbi:MAG: glycosyltransferase family 4 protein [Paludibacter sp.]|nr:glycosyltransferase family 4 protein [Paludibacter sp.]
MSKKKKILFIIHYPPPVHGAANVGLQIKNSKAINEYFGTTFINLSTSKSVDEIGKGSITKLLRYISIFNQVLKNVIFNRPDLCYMSMTSKSPPFYKDAILALMVKLFNIKLVYHFHNKGVSENQNKQLDNFLYKLVFNNSNVILLSENLYPDIKKYVDKSQVYFCPNGITDSGSIDFTENKTDTIQLLFLSNLLVAKGIFVLLEACKRLKEQNIHFNCTFVGGEGDVNTKQFQDEIDRLKLNDCVEYIGKKFGKEKEQIFKESDIFVHPTLNDCFPLVLLEAMQFSLPVISTIEGGIPDIVEEGNTGFLIPMSNGNILAEKLEILINNKELRLKMGKAGRNKFANEFTIDKFENKMLNILKNVINNLQIQ